MTTLFGVEAMQEVRPVTWHWGLKNQIVWRRLSVGFRLTEGSRMSEPCCPSLAKSCSRGFTGLVTVHFLIELPSRVVQHRAIDVMTCQPEGLSDCGWSRGHFHCNTIRESRLRIWPACPRKLISIHSGSISHEVIQRSPTDQKTYMKGEQTKLDQDQDIHIHRVTSLR